MFKFVTNNKAIFRLYMEDPKTKFLLRQNYKIINLWKKTLSWTSWKKIISVNRGKLCVGVI